MPASCPWPLSPAPRGSESSPSTRTSSGSRAPATPPTTSRSRRELLLLEIADVQAARQTQAAADQAAPASGLTLAEIARAVKAGALTLDDYRARAVELGLGQDDVDTLTRVLGDDLAETRAAQARRTELASTLKAQNVSLAVLEDQVRQGALTLDGYFDTLVRAGLAPEDADVLWTLLADELGAGVGAGAPHDARLADGRHRRGRRAVTVATVIYLAGRLEGVVSTRLQDIERRLHEIEHALARLGFTFRGQPLTRTDTRVGA
jgi:hypothetical protein